MPNLEATMQDLSRGYVPIIIVLAMLGTAGATGFWLQSNQSKVENISRDVQGLQQQINVLSASVSQLTLSFAKGPSLPENVAYKADLLRFCLENRELKCPPNL
jgi:outer membrane murein-binding lipoprotein Lpp